MAYDGGFMVYKDLDMRSTAQPYKRSWQELHKAVKNSRNLGAMLSGRVPSSFAFTHFSLPENGKNSMCRVYFLGIPTNGSRLNTIAFVDLQLDSGAVNFCSEWQYLLEDNQFTSTYRLSKQEELLRERKRLSLRGITSFDTDGHGRFVFPASNTLYTSHDRITDEQAEGLIQLKEVSPSLTGAKMDAKLCPCNSDLVSFVVQDDIYVYHSGFGTHTRLTDVASLDLTSLEESLLSAGTPSFVMQEEFDRYTGHWWRPNNPGCAGEYLMLYELVDEREVNKITIIGTRGGATDNEDFSYPRAGAKNARSELRLVQFTVTDKGQIQRGEDWTVIDQDHLPETEYIVRVGWTPDGNYIWAQTLNRAQDKLSLVIVQPNVPSGNQRQNYCVITLEKSDIWINVSNVMEFVPYPGEREPKDLLRFIWSSEKSGYSHLYCTTISISMVSVIEERVLTQGPWVVQSQSLPISIDQKRELVYFTANKSSPLETHLYCVSYENPGEPVQLTEAGYSHTIYMDKECELFVTVYSSIACTPAVKAYGLVHADSQHETTRLPGVYPLGVLMEHTDTGQLGYHPPELFECNSPTLDLPLYGLVFPPLGRDLTQPCPTVLVVYGGPQVQMVSNTFKGHRFLRFHNMASQGFAVVILDSRGSSGRGLHFEGMLKNKLGQVELQDQVEGLRWIASHRPYIDLSRVAIHGTSYGGYLSLMGLVQHPDVFKVSIAGAPVTDWRLYDTGYTERYIGLPHENPDAYEGGSVLRRAELFPSQANRLLIVHGLMDENVHYCHTSALIDRLITAGKPYQLQVYPGERHGIRGSEANDHYETVVLHFLEHNL